jgi:hypothetical protein
MTESLLAAQQPEADDSCIFISRRNPCQTRFGRDGRDGCKRTGMAHGVGVAQKPPRWLQPGDQVSIEIEKISSLQNPVDSEP